MYPSKFVHPFQLGKWYPMSVDRITDKNITSSSPTSSLFLNSTQKNDPLSAGRFSVFRIGRRFRPAKAFFFCGLSDSCHRAQYLYFNDEKPSGHSVCTIPAEKKLQNAKKRQDISPVSFCLLLPKKIQPGKPCGSMDSGFCATCIFVFLRFFQAISEPPY